MSPEERDNKIIEIGNDVKWLREWCLEHKLLHSKYTYFFFITVVGLIIALIK